MSVKIRNVSPLVIGRSETNLITNIGIGHNAPQYQLVISRLVDSPKYQLNFNVEGALDSQNSGHGGILWTQGAEGAVPVQLAAIKLIHQASTTADISFDTKTVSGALYIKADGKIEVATNLVVGTSLYTNTWHASTTSTIYIKNSVSNVLLALESGGNVGVGTGVATLDYKLACWGRGYFSSTNQDAGWGMLTLDYGNGTNSDIMAIQMKEGDAGDSDSNIKASLGFGVHTEDGRGDLVFKTRDGSSLTEKMRILYDGKVGIGTGTNTLSHPLEIWHGTPAINLKDTSSSGQFRLTLDGVQAAIHNFSTGGVLQLLTSGGGDILLSPSGDVQIDGDLFAGDIYSRGVLLKGAMKVDESTLWSAHENIENDNLECFLNGNTLNNNAGNVTFEQNDNTSTPYSKVAVADKLYESAAKYFVPVQAGETLYGEMWIMVPNNASGTAANSYFGISQYDKDKKLIKANVGLTYFSYRLASADGVWYKISGEITLPTAHTVFDGSDGGPVRYVKPYIIINYTVGTQEVHFGSMYIGRRKPFRNRDVAFGGRIELSDGQAVNWDGNNILLHDGTSTKLGDGSASDTVTVTGGKVGIGTGSTAPTQLLDITSATNTAALQFHTSTTGSGSSDGFKISSAGNNVDIWNYETAMIRFATAGVERVRISHDGNVGIGTGSTAPASTLQISADAPSFRIKGNNNPSIWEWSQVDGGSTLFLKEKNQDIDVMSILYGGDVLIEEKLGIGTGSTPPAAKLEVYDSTINSLDLLHLRTEADSVNDYVGLKFAGSTDSNSATLALSAIRSYGGPSAGDSYIALLTSTDGSTLVQGLVQDHRGYVGIGTGSTAPTSKLSVISDVVGYSVYANFGPTTMDSSTREGGIQIHSTAGSADKTWGIWADANSPTALRFEYLGARATEFDSGTDTIALHSDGKVGIGTGSTLPAEKLDVWGNLSLGAVGGVNNSFIDQKQNGSLDLINSSGSKVRINKWNTVAGGTDDFRDFIVYDGKTNALLFVDGSSGNVGIGTGTTAPAELLEVKGGRIRIDNRSTTTSGTAELKFYAAYTNTATPPVEVGNSAKIIYKKAVGVDQLEFELGGATDPQFVFTNSGKLGIGTGASGPAEKLDVRGNISWAGTHSSEVGRLISTDTDSVGIVAVDEMAFYVANANVRAMHIAADGNVGIATTDPQGWRLKVSKEQTFATTALAQAASNDLLRLHSKITDTSTNPDTAYNQEWDFRVNYLKDLTIQGGSGSGGIVFEAGTRGFNFNRTITIDADGDATQLIIKRTSANQDNGIRLTDQTGAKMAHINLEGTSTNDLEIASAGNIRFYSGSDLAADPSNERLRIQSDGTVVFYDNAAIQGSIKFQNGAYHIHGGTVFYTSSDISASSTQARKAAIFEVAINEFHWQEWNGAIIELFQEYYSGSGYSKWMLKAGHGHGTDNVPGSGTTPDPELILMEAHGTDGSQYRAVPLISVAVDTGSTYSTYTDNQGNTNVPAKNWRYVISVEASYYTRWTARVTTQNEDNISDTVDVTERNEIYFYPASTHIDTTNNQLASWSDADYQAVLTESDAMITGKLGLGTGAIAASTKLHIRTSTDHNYEFEEVSGKLRFSALNDARSANVPLQFAASAFDFITGNVGIGTGTTAPGAKLGVVGAIHSFGTGVTPGATSGFQFAASNSTDDGYLWNFENADLVFGANGNEHMRIKAGGKVGIGTGSTAPQNRLHVAIGDSTNDNYRTGADTPLIIETVGAASYIQFVADANERMGIVMGNTTDTARGGVFYDENDGGMIIKSGGTNRVFVSTGGNVGVLQTNPQTPLHIGANDGWNATGAILSLGATESTAYGRRVQIEAIKTGGDDDYIGMRFMVHPNASHTVAPDLEAMRLTHDGKVGIGTGSTTPSKFLHVKSGASGATPSSDVNMLLEGASNVGISMLAPDDQGSRIEFGSATDGNEGIIYYDNANSQFSVYAAGIRTLEVVSGKVGIGTGSTAPSTILNIHGTDPIVRIVGTASNDNATIQLLENQDIPLYGFELQYDGTGDNRFYIKRYDGNTTADIALAIDRATGNVGIGTGSNVPGAKLEIKSDTSPWLKLKLNSATGAGYEDAIVIDGTAQTNIANTFRIGVSWDGTTDSIFMGKTGSGGRILNVTSGNRVGINSTGPDTVLHIKDEEPVLKIEATGENKTASLLIDAKNNDPYISFADGHTTLGNWGIGVDYDDGQDDHDLKFYTGSGSPSDTNSQVQLRIDGDGNVTFGKSLRLGSGGTDLPDQGASNAHHHLLMLEASTGYVKRADTAVQVEIPAPTGTGTHKQATATAIVRSDGVVIGIRIVEKGHGYNDTGTRPVVTLEGGRKTKAPVPTDGSDIYEGIEAKIEIPTLTGAINTEGEIMSILVVADSNGVKGGAEYYSVGMIKPETALEVSDILETNISLWEDTGLATLILTSGNTFPFGDGYTAAPILTVGEVWDNSTVYSVGDRVANDDNTSDGYSMLYQIIAPAPTAAATTAPTSTLVGFEETIGTVTYRCVGPRAKVVAVIVDGKITQISITECGDGYDANNPPSVYVDNTVTSPLTPCTTCLAQTDLVTTIGGNLTCGFNMDPPGPLVDSAKEIVIGSGRRIPQLRISTKGLITGFAEKDNIGGGAGGGAGAGVDEITVKSFDNLYLDALKVGDFNAAYNDIQQLTASHSFLEIHADTTVFGGKIKDTARAEITFEDGCAQNPPCPDGHPLDRANALLHVGVNQRLNSLSLALVPYQGISITNYGSGYTSTPTIKITNPTWRPIEWEAHNASNTTHPQGYFANDAEWVYHEATTSVTTDELFGKAFAYECIKDTGATANGPDQSYCSNNTEFSASPCVLDDWDTTLAYAVGDRTFYQTKNWICIQTTTSSTAPPSASSTFWNEDERLWRLDHEVDKILGPGKQARASVTMAATPSVASPTSVASVDFVVSGSDDGRGDGYYPDDRIALLGDIGNVLNRTGVPIADMASALRSERHIDVHYRADDLISRADNTSSPGFTMSNSTSGASGNLNKLLLKIADDLTEIDFSAKVVPDKVAMTLNEVDSSRYLTFTSVTPSTTKTGVDIYADTGLTYNPSKNDLTISHDLSVGNSMTVGDSITVTNDLIVGDDLLLRSDSSQLRFGLNDDVILTHVHNSGLDLNLGFKALSYRLNDSFEWDGAVTFDHDTDNQVSYLEFGNRQLWGWVEVTLTGGYSNANMTGKYTKRYKIGRNGDAAVHHSGSEVPSAYGDIVGQFKLGDFELNSSTVAGSKLRIPIYHLTKLGNALKVHVKLHTGYAGQINGILDDITLTTPVVVVNTETRDYHTINSDKVGIGTGTNTLTYDLTVQSSAAADILIGSTTGSRAILILDGANNGDGIGGDYAYLAQEADGRLKISNINTNNTIEFEGKVGIGTGSNAPSSLLHIKQSSGSDGVMLDVESNNDGGIRFGRSGHGSLIVHRTTSKDYMAFHVEGGSQPTVGGTPKMVINEDGNVGVGNTNPSLYHAEADDLVVGTTSGSHGITIASGNTSKGSIYFADGTDTTNDNHHGTNTAASVLWRGYIQYNHTSSTSTEEYLRIGVGGTDVMRIEPDRINIIKALDVDAVADISGTLTLSKATGIGLSVTKDATIGGTLGVTGATTLNGNVTLGNAATDAVSVAGYFSSNLLVSKSSPILVLRDDDNTTANNHTGYISFLDKNSAEKARVGFDNSTNDDISIQNNYSGGHVLLTTSGTGIVKANGDLLVGGGLSVTDDITVYDNIQMASDSAKITFGEHNEVSLEHVHDTGLLLGGALELQFRDSGLTINSSANGQLDIDADGTVQITAPTVDINASTKVDISNDLFVGGKLDVTGLIEVGPDSTAGGIFLQQDYSGNDIINSFSSQRDSGTLVLGYGARGGASSTEGNVKFWSTFDNFSGWRSALSVHGNQLKFSATPAAVQTTVGGELTTMVDVFTLNQNGDGGVTGSWGCASLTIGGATETDGLTVNGDFTINTDANSSLSITDEGDNYIKMVAAADDVLRLGGNAAWSLELAASNNNAKFRNDLNVVGALDVDGALNVGGASTLTSAELSTTLDVAGTTTLMGDLHLESTKVSINAPANGSYINFSTTSTASGNASKYLRVGTYSGSWMHFYTDESKYYFNKDVYANGEFYKYVSGGGHKKVFHEGNLTPYSHPGGDGNLHVTATGTGNSGNVLTAGTTAGSLSWVTPNYLEIGTTGSTAMAGNTTTITSTQATAIGANSTHAASAHAPSGAEVNVQSNWTSTSGDSKILNKPTTITSAQATAIGANSTHAASAHAPSGAEVNVQSNWTSTSGDSKILNKPALGTASTKAISDFAAATHTHSYAAKGVNDDITKLKKLGLTAFEIEGTENAHEVFVNFTNPTADRTITFPNATGTVSLTSHSHSGYALTSHSHSGYALTSHSHSGYALTSHSHSGYALTSHTHSEFINASTRQPKFKFLAGPVANPPTYSGSVTYAAGQKVTYNGNYWIRTSHGGGYDHSPAENSYWDATNSDWSPTFRSIDRADLPRINISGGGTGAITAATARTNLGLGASNSVEHLIIKATNVGGFSLGTDDNMPGEGPYAEGPDPSLYADIIVPNGTRTTINSGVGRWNARDRSQIGSGTSNKWQYKVINGSALGTRSHVFQGLFAEAQWIYKGGSNRLSDTRLKYGVEDSDLGLDLVRLLKPVSYFWLNAKSPRTKYGLIAHEVEEALEELGVENASFVNIQDYHQHDVDDGRVNDLRFLDYDQLYNVLINAVKQLDAKVQELEAKIDEK